jgi:hypothetical protein
MRRREERGIRPIWRGSTVVVTRSGGSAMADAREHK